MQRKWRVSPTLPARAMWKGMCGRAPCPMTSTRIRIIRRMSDRDRPANGLTTTGHMRERLLQVIGAIPTSAKQIQQAKIGWIIFDRPVK